MRSAGSSAPAAIHSLKVLTVGEAKRRKQLDPNWGKEKPKPNLPEVVNLKALWKTYSDSEVESLLQEDSDSAEVVNFLLGAFYDAPVVSAGINEHGEQSYRIATNEEIKLLKTAGVIPAKCKGQIQQKPSVTPPTTAPPEASRTP
jgi:hypothetical protein